MESDADAFTNCVASYDALSQLTGWTVALLLRIKTALAGSSVGPN